LKVKNAVDNIKAQFKKYKLFRMTGGRQIVRITKDTFRENFDHSNKIGETIADFDGKFFDAQRVKGETVYSDGTLAENW
jgi:hypothetical protein